MKIPGLGKIATFALKIGKGVALAVVVRAVASDKVSLSKKDVTDAIAAEGERLVRKRLGA
jgi:hypothetical protein